MHSMQVGMSLQSWIAFLQLPRSKLGALHDVPADGGERWLAPVRVPRAAGLVPAGAPLHDAPAELGPGLHDRGDGLARLVSADGGPRELGLDLRLLAPLKRPGL